MELLVFLGLLGAGTAYAAENLFVSSYSGALSTLSLQHGDHGGLVLKNISVDLGCSPSPSWLTLDVPSKTLYCIGEGLTTTNGSLSSYAISENSTLAQSSKVDTISGPVYGAVYGATNGTRAIALPHYGNASISSFSISSDAKLAPIQNISFPAPNPPGPFPDRQTASHPHETIVDPTGQYVLVPDLGADLVRVFTYDAGTAQLRAAGNPLQVKPGTGPRHAAFHVNGNYTYLYLVAELGATITAYTVAYQANAGGLTFQQIYSSDTLGGATATRTVAPAEVRIAPDNRFLIVSNRNDSTFALPNTNPKNATAIPSDSLATYQILAGGGLNFAQLWPAGGSYARSFDINAKGDKIAVGLQNDGRIAVWARDVKTGLLQGELASLEGPDVGQVTRVVWDECTGSDGVIGRA